MMARYRSYALASSIFKVCDFGSELLRTPRGVRTSMATVLLSLWINTFCGIPWALVLHNSTKHIVNPAGPVLSINDGQHSTGTFSPDSDLYHKHTRKRQVWHFIHLDQKNKLNTFQLPYLHSFALPDKTDYKYECRLSWGKRYRKRAVK